MLLAGEVTAPESPRKSPRNLVAYAARSGKEQSRHLGPGASAVRAVASDDRWRLFLCRTMNVAAGASRHRRRCRYFAICASKKSAISVNASFVSGTRSSN
jgi:hypothetical protein